MPLTTTGRKSPRLRTTIAIIAAAAAALAAIGAPIAAQAAVTDTVTVTVNGADVAAAAKNVNGLTFKGFGLLSGNSTSALLMDYKSQHPDDYWKLIQTLFGGSNPIMNTVKIEMGNDRNTSTGPEAATMRTRDEYPNVEREPGFQLAADAQKVATGTVHVSLLRWSRPTWVATDADQYIWFKNTILAAYREYGIMVDSVNPDTNETGSPNAALYKSFSGWLRGDTTGYQGATATDPNNGFSARRGRPLPQHQDDRGGHRRHTAAVVRQPPHLDHGSQPARRRRRRRVPLQQRGRRQRQHEEARPAVRQGGVELGGPVDVLRIGGSPQQRQQR